MAANTAPTDLYIAAYPDPMAAQADWNGIKQLAKDDVIKVDGLVLVSREEDGKINVKDNARDAGKGAAIGAVGGAVVGLIFPPAVLGTAIVGAAAGAGIGGLREHRRKNMIKEDVENVLPPGSSGIVAVFEEQWVPKIERALSAASSITKHEIDPESAEHVKTNAPESGSMT
jgi:uncharacterized membrane protein